MTVRFFVGALGSEGGKPLRTCEVQEPRNLAMVAGVIPDSPIGLSSRSPEAQGHEVREPSGKPEPCLQGRAQIEAREAARTDGNSEPPLVS